MIMRKDDLTRFKHVGVSRMKLLNDLGITTIKQLYEMPEEKLAEIKSIGEHYAKQIKNSVTEYYKEKHEKLPAEIVSAKERKTEQINRDLQKKIKRLRNSLKRANENLKPLGKKKYLESYIDFKKRSTKLKARLNEIGQIQEDLPKKVPFAASSDIEGIREIASSLEDGGVLYIDGELHERFTKDGRVGIRPVK